ncbi:5-oxoprolinase subunit C family protein [Thermoactinomyces mirandus]|uniref:Biotin-dependent carboxyltransferase family protein n=1 Tax=Thermoactinomyces mirandus TaxID=2756294 RepID=A0A7W2ARR1_9BACL|nr:biotin-dependent carboxyltransferase family protein [Thermoactinomyces mirandus]MBA4601850.1 biotin-dependent carboxyltransferase family protein [Thermoactinomyces mirandus]
MSIKVIRAGMLTSIQDLGRYGMQKHGIIVSGAMDPFALRVGNLLVGNEEREAALEITMLGPTLQFLEDSLIAICGGNLSPKIDGHKIPGWRPILVKKGSILEFGAARSGCRAYLTLAGGFDIPQVMGSRSTYLRAGLGGFQGRALKKGDILNLRAPSELANKMKDSLSKTTGVQLFSTSKWSVSNRLLSFYQKKTIIRVLPGNQFYRFTWDSRKKFFTRDFFITQQSDRMGYQLKGPQTRLSEPLELVSEAVSTGTVQIPPAGNPIILMADRQTTGGYPKIAQIINVDIPILAQIKPGEKIRFQMVTLEESQELYRTREVEIRKLKLAIASKVQR